MLKGYLLQYACHIWRCDTSKEAQIIYHGTIHDINLNSEQFKKEGYLATKKALKEAELLCLEPIMKLNIKIKSEELRAVVLADISKRRGIACGRGGDEDNLGDMYVPLAEMVDYDNELYALTNGQASFEMKFERYEVVPEYLEK